MRTAILRSRRNRGRPPQMYKHVVDTEAQGDFSAAVTTIDIVVGLDNPVLGNTTNVEARAQVRNIFMELSYSYINNTVPAANNQNSLHWVMYYTPQSSIAGSAVSPAGQGSVAAKAYIFKSGKLDIDFATQRVAKTVGVIKVPRKYGTIMNTDKIRLAFQSVHFMSANSENISFKAIYKEIRS